MKRLATEQRAHILHLLVENVSMRAITRITGVSINTVAKLLTDAGAACSAYHHAQVVGIQGTRTVQCDELWSFIYAKDRAIDYAEPWDTAGTVWTFTALDADNKLLLTYLIRKRRGIRAATKFMCDLQYRLVEQPVLITDSLPAYRNAARTAFGRAVNLTQIVKGHDTTASTSFVERHNLTIRMSNRRYSRSTNAFSKLLAQHCAAMHLFAVWYNFCRIHQTLRVTPAMEAGLTATLYDLDWIVELIDKSSPKPKKPGPAIGSVYKQRS